MVGVVLISELFGEFLDTLGNAGFLVELLIHHINVRNVVDRLVLVILEVGPQLVKSGLVSYHFLLEFFINRSVAVR